MLEIRNLVKHFQVGEGKPIYAVDGVSMDIAAGESVALYGPSGSGKTTLIDLIAGLKRPDSGSIHVDGRDVVAMSASQTADYQRKDIGIVMPTETLMAGTKVIRNASIKLIMEGVGEAESKAAPLLTSTRSRGSPTAPNRPTVDGGAPTSPNRDRAVAEAKADTRRRANCEPGHRAYARSAWTLPRELCHTRNMALFSLRPGGCHIRRPTARTARRSVAKLPARSRFRHPSRPCRHGRERTPE